MISCDVLIIGAGAAGLTAARDLAHADLRVLVLEARNRLGGRIWSTRQTSWPLPIELGAEFLHGRPHQTWELLQAGRLTPYDIPDQHWLKTNDRLERQGELTSAIDVVLQRILEYRGDDLSFADFLRRHCDDIGEPERQLALGYVEGFDAADPEKISVLSLQRAERESPGEEQFRLRGGYASLIEWFRTELRRVEIRINTVARSIDWRPGSATIVTRGPSGEAAETYQAQRLVITVPVGVLQARDEWGGLNFTPPLEEKQRAARMLRSGAVVKIVLRFETPFWEAEHTDELSFFHAFDQPFPTWWTTLPMRTAMLTGWAGGPAAERLAGLSEFEILSAALDSLAHALGVSRSQLHAQLKDWQFCDWQSEPYARGAYSYVAVGGMPAIDTLAAPVENTLFFAGEATDPSCAGTVAAAIASGHRAAREVIEAAQVIVSRG